jgi:hypothetical protein
MPTKQVTKRQLVNRLKQLSGSTFASLVTATQPRMKAGAPHREVVKIARLNVVLNHDYSNSVNRQRIREGEEPDFVPEPHPYADRVPGTPLRVNRKNPTLKYLTYKLQQRIEVRYIDKRGAEIPEEDLKPWFYQRTNHSQELEYPVIVNDVLLDNIQQITMMGTTYQVA